MVRLFPFIASMLVALALWATPVGAAPAGAAPQSTPESAPIQRDGAIRMAQRYYYDPYSGRRYRSRGYDSRRYRPYRPRRAPVRRARPRPAPAVSLWKVEETNKDPVQLYVSLPDQKMKVYKGSELVSTSQVSSGRAGYSTPAGVFSILEKKRRHFSNLYGGAPMPNMQRLTWSGVAMHASGSVPGYPASHGCIRLPPSFARQLFPFTTKGAHVIVTNEEVTPQEINHVALFQPLGPEPEPVASNETTQSITPADAAKPAAAEVGWLDWLTGSTDTKPEIASAKSDALRAGKAAAISPTRVALMQDPGAASPTQYGAGSATPPKGEEDAKPASATPAKTEPKSLSPIRILVTRRTGREQFLEIQKLLFDLGHEPGDIDGFMGRDTAKAIRRFQDHEGLAVNGLMTDDLLGQLHKAAGIDDAVEGHIYVRRNHKDVFDAPVLIRNPETPLGTHLFTVMHFEDEATQARWLGVSLKDRVRRRKANRRARAQKTAEAPVPEPTQTMTSAAEALDRISIPEDLQVRISRMLRPGSSLAISDYGLGPETGKGTDFIVLTR